MRFIATCFLLFFIGCATKAITSHQAVSKLHRSWKSFSVAIRDGRQTVIYSLSNDGVLRLSCVRGISNLTFREHDLSTDDFNIISTKIAELEGALTLNRQAVGAVVVSLVEDRTGLNMKSKAFRAVNSDPRVEGIIQRFQALLPDCSKD